MASTPADAARDWWLYDQEEPLGNREIRHQLARLCSMIFNRFRDEKSAATQAEDFMFRSPQINAEREAEIVQNRKRNMIEGLKLLATAQGGRTPRRRKKARK
jgi:hypothetical protein